MIFYTKTLKSPKLFLCIFLSATFAIINQVKAQEEVTCSSEGGFDAASYNLRLHVGALFIILSTSSLGAFIPVISKKFPGVKIPNFVFFFCKHFGTGVIIATAFIHMIPSAFEALTDECLPEVWRNYPAWAGAIAMMSASLIFFIEYIALKMTEKAIRETLPMHKGDKPEPVSIATDSDISQEDGKFHPHSHGTLVLLTGQVQNIGIIILEAGICLHSIIIGMTLSVTTGSDFISLLVALVFHQMFEGLGLGSRIAELELPKNSIKQWLMAFAYGTTTPIGIAIGLGVRETYDPDSATAKIVTGVLDSISAGILLYAAFVELIANDFIYDPNFHKKSARHQSSAFILLLLGAGIMSLIGYWA